MEDSKENTSKIMKPNKTFQRTLETSAAEGGRSVLRDEYIEEKISALWMPDSNCANCRSDCRGDHCGQGRAVHCPSCSAGFGH